MRQGGLDKKLRQRNAATRGLLPLVCVLSVLFSSCTLPEINSQLFTDSDVNKQVRQAFALVDSLVNAQHPDPVSFLTTWRLIAWKKLMGNPKKGLVFPSPKSTPDREIAMTGDNVSKRFKFYATEEAKLKDTVNFHGLRHSCATFMLRIGFNVIEVKNMLGHKSLEVTNRYVHLVAKDLMRSANRNGKMNYLNEA